ncbi:MAG TPA: AGE family epimerase/isomerase [Verrucomicrobiae bacterium]|nr:AGE family epimerase/isomerase [Verrucomicrobiae bacterium]
MAELRLGRRRARIFAPLAFLFPTVVAPAAERLDPMQYPAGNTGYTLLAEQMEAHLRQGVLRFWFPRCVDREHGGFRPNFLDDGSPGTENDKTIVFQSRMTWVAAQVALRCPDLAEEFRPYAEHGVGFLAEKMWDKEFGGPFWQLDPTGHLRPGDPGDKHLYGVAFCIYAAAAARQAIGSERAMDLARSTFRWLDQHARDSDHGGYHETLARSGTPILSRPPNAKSEMGILGAPYGFKSMNAHIHLLEALTALHGVWPDPVVTARLNEVFEIVRDRIAVPPGALHLFFAPDWRPVPGLDSYGHDVETAYLLIEAHHALKREDGAKTLAIARSLVDNPLRHGWDHALGGFYDSGSPFGQNRSKDKIWWTQAEGLNALLLMHEHFGNETPKYYEAFLQQWAFIWNYQIDHTSGEWFQTVSPQGEPEHDRPKGSYWKAAYHNGRALLNVVETLRTMAEE